MVSAYADDVSTFVSSRSNIEVALKVLEQYEKFTEAKINCDKLGAWKGVALPGPFGWKNGPVRILGVGSDPTFSWRKIGQQ